MHNRAYVRGLFIVCAAVTWTNAAFAAATTAAQYITILKNNGFSDGPGSFTFSSGSDVYSVSANNVSDALTQFNTQFPPGTEGAQIIANKYFADIFPGGAPSSIDLYNMSLFTQFPALNTAPFFASITFAGVSVQLSFPANSNTLTLNVTGTNIHQTFTGATRYDTVQLAGNYVKNNQSLLLNDIHNAMASATISDPVIGNPQSLVGQMASVANFFGTPVGEGGSPGQKIDPILSASMQPQFYSADSLNGYTLQVPLAYSWFDQDDPRYAVTVDMPLSYQHQGFMDTYYGGLGVGYRIPLADHWYVTPQAHASVVVNLNSQAGGVQYGAAVFSFAASSKYNMYFNDDTLKVSLIDTAGYYRSTPVDIGSLHIDPNIKSGIFSNGLTGETPSSFTLFGNRTTWQGYVLDTRVVGTHSQIAGWDEIGVSFGTADDLTAQTWENLRIGASFSFAREDYKAYELNLTERF